MKKILSIAVCLLTVSAFAQTSTIQWEKSFGGTDADIAWSILQTPDGGYITAGNAMSVNGDVTGNHVSAGAFQDFWIVKMSAAGTMQWQKCYGGSTNDDAISMIQTFDGNYVVAGFTDSNDGDVTGNHGQVDCWVIKISPTGTLLWEKSYGGSLIDDIICIKETSDHGYIFSAITGSNNGNVTGYHGMYDYWVVKLDINGALQWQKTLGGSGTDQPGAILQTADGGYIVTGESESNDGDVTGNHGNSDSWVVKLSSSGSIQWQKSYGGTRYDWSRSIIQTSDKGYVIAGTSSSNDGDVTGVHGIGQDFWLIKTDSLGVIQWQKTYGGTNDEIPYAFQKTTEGGYVIAGYTQSNDGDVTGNHSTSTNDYWIVKTSSSGSLQWQRTLGGTSDDQAYSICQGTDGEYVIAGYSKSTDGDVTGNHGMNDYWVVKLSSVTGIENISSKNKIIVYPDPASNFINVQSKNANLENSTIEIQNYLGQTVLSLPYSKTVDISSISSGSYILNLKLENGQVFHSKIIKE